MRRLLRALRRDHVAFLGPRRTGKTSVLKDLVTAPPPGIVPIFLDLQKFDSVPAWLGAMLAATRGTIQSDASPWASLKSSAKQTASVLKRIEQIQVLGVGIKLTAGQPAAESWRPVADQFLALLRDDHLPIYFLLDEFPWFLGHVAKKHTTADVESVLNWFREARHELADLQARFLVTGSIGLDGLLRRLALSPAANDFDTVDIPPLEEAEALQLLADLAEGESLHLPAPIRAHILVCLGANWPLLLQLFVSEIQESGITGEPSIAAIDRIYAEQMVRGNRNKYCQEMFTRLTKPDVFSVAERRLALEILRELAGSRKPFASQHLEAIHARVIADPALHAQLDHELAFVLDTLRHDGYLQRNAAGLTDFASHILRDYWRHRTA